MFIQTLFCRTIQTEYIELRVFSMKNKNLLLVAAIAALSGIFLITSAAAFAVNVPKKIQPNRIQTRKVNSAPRLNSNSMNVPNGPNVPEKIREAPAQTAVDIQKYEDEQERLRILREYWQIMYPSNSTVQPNKEINKNKE